MMVPGNWGWNSIDTFCNFRFKSKDFTTYFCESTFISHRTESLTFLWMLPVLSGVYNMDEHHKYNPSFH